MAAGNSSPLLVAVLLVILTMIAIRLGGGHASRAIVRMTGGGTTTDSTSLGGSNIDVPRSTSPSTGSSGPLVLPGSMSGADLEAAIRKHHPLNRLECGSWPEVHFPWPIH